MGLGGVPSGCSWRVGWWQASRDVRPDTLKKQPGWEQVQRAGLCPGPFLPCATQHLTGEGRSQPQEALKMLLGSQLHDLWRSLHEGGISPPPPSMDGCPGSC